MANLTMKQARFCEEYIVDLNATQAAARAGYSKKSAKAQGSVLLTNPDVQERIQSMADRRSERTEITADRVLQEIAKMAFVNIDDFSKPLIDSNGKDTGWLTADLSDLTRDHMAAIQEFHTDYKDGVPVFKFKLSDKKANLELLGKNLKLFTDRVDIRTPDGVTFNNDYGDGKK